MSKLEDLASQVASLGRDASSVSHQLNALRTRVARLHDQLSGAARAGVDVRGVQQSIAASAQAVQAGAASAGQAAQLASQFANSLVAGAATGGLGGGGGGNGGGGGAGGGSDLPSMEDLADGVRQVNPNYNPTDPDSDWSNNCGSCAVSTLGGLMGGQFQPAGPYSLSPEEMEEAIGQPQTPMSPAEIEQAMRDAGPGSAAVVGFDNEPGHWFNAYHDGNNVYCVDGQTGTISGWPPTFQAATNWDAAIFSQGGS